jgi:hypothetical protein
VGPVQAVVSKPAKPVPLRRKLAYVLGVVLLAVLGGAAWWWFHRPMPAYKVQDPGIYPLPVMSADGKTQKVGFIDADGKVLIQPGEWDDVFSKRILDQPVFFSGGFCGVKKDGKWGFIDTSGKLVIPDQFDEVGPFMEGLASVKLGSQWGFIDNTGSYAINPQFDQVGDFHEGLAAVHKDDGWGFINKAGRVVIPPRGDYGYVDPDGFSDGLAGVCLKASLMTPGSDWRSCNYIHRDGTSASPTFHDVTTFSEGLAAVRGNNSSKWGFINTSGNQYVIDPQFDAATMFLGGLAVVAVSGKTGTINRKGKYVVNPGQYQFAVKEGDPQPVTSSGGHGLMTRDGKWVAKPIENLETNILEPEMWIGKVVYYQFYKELIPTSMSGKVLAGPHKGETVDSLAQDVANTISAEKSFRALIDAEARYSVAYPAKGFTTSLDKLGPATGAPDQNHAGMIDAELATGTKDGYRFTVTIPAGNSAAGTNFNYFLAAKPIAGHVGLSFCTDSTRTPHIAMEGEECTLSTPGPR